MLTFCPTEAHRHMSIGKKWEKSPANSIIFTKFASPSAVFQPAHSTCNMRTAKPTPTAEERFAEYLRSNRKRRTAERFAILDRVMATQGHFSAEELCEMMRRDDYPVSVATVYATLELLVNCGLATRPTCTSGLRHPRPTTITSSAPRAEKSRKCATRP